MKLVQPKPDEHVVQVQAQPLAHRAPDLQAALPWNLGQVPCWGDLDFYHRQLGSLVYLAHEARYVLSLGGKAKAQLG